MPQAGFLARSALLIAAAALVLAGCDWPTFRFDATHTGYNPFERTLDSGNVATLTEDWIADAGDSVESSPIVAGGVLYEGSNDGKLYAFDASGNTNCTGSAPKTCEPLWTAQTGGSISSTPAKSGNTVYAGSSDGILYAFDAAGNTNCSGSPKTCLPLWTANTFSSINFSSPVVAGGRVFVGTAEPPYKLEAFDAAGVNQCTGVPKQCSPLWIHEFNGAVLSSPAVANGILYVGAGNSLYAFNAAPDASCGGTPPQCRPLWIGPTGDAVFSSPAVVNGVVYVGSNDGLLYAFSTTVGAQCAGSQHVCLPLWRGRGNAGNLSESMLSSPAVANGVVYIGSGDGYLYAFDATGVANCDGAQVGTCDPMWRGSLNATGDNISSPAIANGVVYVGASGGNGPLLAFDAAGNLGCSGVPLQCAPLFKSFNFPGIVSTSPAVVDGRVYVGDSYSGGIHVFALP